ncbi:acyl-CoA dehydrogenase family protein [Rhodococcus sp. JVH1]|uniref:acyl-CoA dehydrogenase family protein n=1 Tax=Rhodococcus sp. JVH1 TaxID=745408 RepID=UPI00027213B8|nr:acyl-CoA dehydrogenase family protein [Rhodococcus sp. JVH1]EJI93887.1 acyl-CoA dehydrogenase, N-terminal domain protein [Rhodococcus sp. JVH1]
MKWNETLRDEQKLFLRSLTDACRRFDDTYWAEHEEAHEFPAEFFKAMAEMGVIGMLMPPEYGGEGGSLEDAALALQTIAATGAGLNGCSAIHLSMFGFHPLVVHGTEELKQRYLPRVAAGDIHIAFGVTEPNAGIDTGRVSTRAVRDGDDWKITGRKVWMTKAGFSEAALVLTRTRPVEETKRPIDGLTLFVVDMDSEYVDARPIKKMGRNAVASYEVAFDGLPVSAANMVGEEGRGFYTLLDGLNPERILVAAEAIGIGLAAVERASRYAKERVVFGKAIGSHQGIAHPLADAYMQLLAANHVMLDAARRYDRGESCGLEANTAKFLAGRAGFFAADRAVQTHGGYGYASEYVVERLFREVRLTRIAPIPEEMILNFVAEQELGLPRSY